MNPLQNACAHEFEDRPPPTAADYARLDKAMNTIFNKGNTEMTEQAIQTTDEEITVEMLEEAGATSALAAMELFKQDGWAIVARMQKALLQGINATSLIVLPVVANLEEVSAKMTDPTGFKKIIATLQNDIGEVIKTVKVLGEQHVDKEGGVSADEMNLVDTISLGYSRLQDILDRAIQPLVLQVAELLEGAGITSLELK